MRLEFEPNAAALPFIESEVADDNAFSEAERLLRAGIKAAQEGRRAEARPLLLRVTELHADNENAWLWLASISEYPEELLVFLGNVLKVNPNNERALEWQKATRSLLAKTLVQRGIDATKDERNDFARQCFEQALGHEAGNEMAWLWLASVAEREEDKTACLEKVVAINPANETAVNSLKAIQSQKTQSLFNEALTRAFEGEHEAAGEMIKAVIERASDLEDAWVLKAHLADSFEERAECFLKIRALNPENKMANACLASWRELADKRLSQTKAGASNAPVETLKEVLVQSPAASFEPESAAAFSANPSEAEFSTQAVQAADDYAALAAEEDEPAQPGAPEAVQMVESETLQAEPDSEESSVREEYPESDSPTQELTFPPDFEPFAAAPQTEATPVMHEEAAFDAEVSANPETAAKEEATAQEFSVASMHFDSEPEPAAEESLSVSGSDLASELEAEEETMNLAFAEVESAVEAENDFDFEQEFEQNSYDFSADMQEGEEHFVEITLESADLNWDEHFELEPEEFQTPAAQSAAETVETAEQPEDETVENHWQAAAQTVEEEAFEEFAPAAALAPAETPAEEADFPAEMPVEHEVSAEALEAAEVTQEPVSMASPDAEPVSHVFEESVAMEENPGEENLSFEPSEEEPLQSKAEMLVCPFCEAENERQAFVCHSCRTVLTLSDLEMLLGWQISEPEKLEQALAGLKSEYDAGTIDLDKIVFIGIGEINLKNYREGFEYLQEAAQLNPSNVVLSAQVNSLAIRLAEIEEQQSAQEAQPKNRRILVVDDSPTVRKLISGKLEKSGHEVICAVDGVDALEKINEVKPDLILLDITMPRMDGYQVCKMLRTNEATKNVPVVMISGKDGFFDKVRGRMAGTTGYITKPFGPETLMKTVESYLS